MKRAWSLILTLAMLASMIAALPLTAQAEASEAWFVDHIVDPTCTEQGYTVEYNMFTYETRNVNYKPALGHIWGNWNLLSEPDCTHTGQRVRYCRRCQTRDVETLPALGHSWNAWKEFLPGTCIQKQVLIHNCTRCGIEEMWTKDYGDHDWGEWEVVKAPTATEPGEERRVCKNTPNHVETREIPATGEVIPPEEEPKPSLYLEITWDENAGEGKRFEGAFVPVYYKVTNTGNCPVYVAADIRAESHYTSAQENFVYPNGVQSDGYALINPGESWSFTNNLSVSSDEVETGILNRTDVYDWARWYNHEGKKEPVRSNEVTVKIPLTYPEDSGKIEVRKVDADTGDALEGALLQILDDGGKVVDQWTSGAENSHTVQGLLSGKQYTLREARPPEGYDTAADIQFVLNEDGKITTTGTISAGGVLVVEDKKLDDGPHPALLLEDTWAANAGEGKRVKGATVPIYCKVTNTGDCTVYRLHDYYSDLVTDIVYPNGETYVPELGEVAAAIQPGESWTLTYNQEVSASAVEKGFLEFYDSDHAWYFDANNDLCYVNSNKFPVHIDLTYPDGTTPEEDKPAIKLTVVQITPEKEAYVDTHDLIEENLIFVDVIVTNTGNVPLWFKLEIAEGPKDYKSAICQTLNPGESWKAFDYFGFDFWYYICDWKGYLPPDSTDSPYLGIYPWRFRVSGFDTNDHTKLLCEDGPVEFKHNIYKPGTPTPWPIPEESQMDVKIETLAGPSDPAGYQLGEKWSTKACIMNVGPVEAKLLKLRVDFTATDEKAGKNWPDATEQSETGYTNDMTSWSEANLEASGGLDLLATLGHITPEDVQRGYVEVKAYVTWLDPDSGKERTAYSNVWNVPVISKTGLVLTKQADTPPNGEYYKPGEKVNWTLDVTNNSKEPIKNVVVTDNGTVIATYAEIAAGETKNCAVPPTTVTDYDAQVTGYVMNTAKATGTDLKDATHTWYSNPAKAVCKDPDTPPVLGAKPGLSAVKTDNGPKNGSYYQENEEIAFKVTVTNTGDCELNNLEFYDSLAGFAPVDTLASLPVSASHTFNYKYTVKPGDMNYPTLTNTATIKYTFLGNPGTPVTCKDTVKIGENDTITETDDPPFDPGLLKGDGDYCSLTLETLGANDARYTLHACGTHSAAAAEAENADLAGDWKKAAGIWQAEIDKLYETLYAAATNDARGVLLEEKLQFENETGNLAALYGDKAMAETLRLKCAELCCVIHTASETLPSSLTANLAVMTVNPDAEATTRVIGALKSSDSEVTDTFAGSAARALEATMDLLHSAKSYDYGDVFLRAQQLWQGALDESVNAAYAAADRDSRKLIVLWRLSLDSFLAAERPLLELLYPDNRATVEEVLMDIYKDAGFGK